MYNVIHLASVYAHPLEYMVANAFPSLASAFIAKNKIHAITYFIWITIRFIETHEGHSGLEFEYSPFAAFPFSAGPRYHNYHHLKNQGNYASFTRIWDSMFGTNEPYFTKNEKKEKLN